MVPRAGEGDGAGGVTMSVDDDLVDKFGAIVAVELADGEGKAY